MLRAMVPEEDEGKAKRGNAYSPRYAMIAAVRVQNASREIPAKRCQRRKRSHKRSQARSRTRGRRLDFRTLINGEVFKVRLSSIRRDTSL